MKMCALQVLNECFWNTFLYLSFFPCLSGSFPNHFCFLILGYCLLLYRYEDLAFFPIFKSCFGYLEQPKLSSQGYTCNSDVKRLASIQKSHLYITKEIIDHWLHPINHSASKITVSKKKQSFRCTRLAQLLLL